MLEARMAASPIFRFVLIACTAAALAGAAVVGVLLALPAAPTDPALPSVAERIADLRTERAGLQARADAEARIALLPAFRTAGLLVDDLAARHERDGDRAFDRLSPAARSPFEALEKLNDALREALERQTEGARAAAVRAGEAAAGVVDRMVPGDGAAVLAYAPAFVPPRRAPGDLSLPAPAFAPPVDDEPAVTVEVVGAHLVPSSGAAPVLSVGGWRGAARVRDGRLVFTVPRSAFPSETTRTAFTLATLTLRREARPVTFQLLFTVLPDKPGWFALDQRVRSLAPESNTLVSPEILARAAVGETRTVRRCFDPPEGWRFDPERVRVVIVERLGWEEDASDASLNGGSVDIVKPDRPGQVCLSVVAKPMLKTARTATIGRFEATLVRDVLTETTVRSGVRALDWCEAMRVPLDPRMTEWKLYVRLFDGIDREFGGRGGGASAPLMAPFLSIETEEGGKALILRADPAAVPSGG